MPGISDRSSLRNSILDSLSIENGLRQRLSSRGLFDIDSSVRLRQKERDYLMEHHPDDYKEMADMAWDAIRTKKAGNHYVYSFMLDVTNISEEKDLYKTCRDPNILESFNLQGLLMLAKLPEEMCRLQVEEAAEGYNKIQARYIVLRSLHNAIYTAHSRSGAHRGKMQSLNVKNKDDKAFDSAFHECWEILCHPGSCVETVCPWSSTVSVGEGLTVKMTRLSDLIFMRVNHIHGSVSVIATSNHLDRMTTFLKQYSNALMGYTIAYSSEVRNLGVSIASDIRYYIRELCRIGLKDDLAPGETGKAVTDLIKAHLSQTDELPWNNFKMLLKTYSIGRRYNAENLWSVFKDYRYDNDIRLNISFIWKLCPQPDSNIRSDFTDLTEGLKSPNSVSNQAAEHIELAFRRAFLVGVLREKRQPKVEAAEGYTIPEAVMKVCKLSRVTETDLREVTFGMMKGLTVRVSDVFPSVSDTSHLTFKDKSSACSDMKLRKQIWFREQAQLACESDYDIAIAEHAVYQCNSFLQKISTNYCEDNYEKALRSTTNDILSSIDEDLSTVFKEAEYKYRSITKSLRKMADDYGSETYLSSLIEWSKDNPELLINTGTEPKLGEVHKRTVRIFYMFEKGMKTFLSQFERMSRLMDHYIRGAEIVKGDRAREKHMNILSSAHKSLSEGVLSYQILFDLSKFSQKFNHKIIDSAAKVIGEACDYPDYQYISDIFKASFLFVSARNVDTTYVGVLGCFEGFLNFLWTGIHATVMDIALRACGRSGDLAAYSDDGLLMFTMRSNIDSPLTEIHAELEETISSIIKTYKDYGLDFNLGKTIISRTLAEFLGVIQYKGKRLPTWTKEMMKLGTSEGRKVISSLGGEVIDTAAQMEAMVKAGMPPYAAIFLGCLEISLGPGRRLISETRSVVAEHSLNSRSYTYYLVPAIFLCLNSSFGGVRFQDALTLMTTADHDPISEMLQDLKQLSINYPEVENLIVSLLEKIEPSEDYTELLNGAVPLSTSVQKYGANFLQKQITGKLKNKFAIFQDHPLSKKKAPKLHEILEHTTNVAPYVLSSLTRYLGSLVEYNKVSAPLKANSMAKLIPKNQRRSIQKSDTTAVKNSMRGIIEDLGKWGDGSAKDVTSDRLYSMSYPKVRFCPTIPSYRQLSKWSKKPTTYSYKVSVFPNKPVDGKGSLRLMNTQFADDLAPPLVTTDISIQHISQAPDVISHCTRALYSEIISAASQGHNIISLAEEVLTLNGICALPESLITAIQDLRKIAVANRKKHIHRVHWAAATKCNILVARLHGLNEIMSVSSNVNYSLIVTVAIAQMHLLSSLIPLAKSNRIFYIDIDPIAAKSTKILRMVTDTAYTSTRERPITYHFDSDTKMGRVMRSISTEAFRQIEQLRVDIQDNMILGRMNMLADFKVMGQRNRVAEPLRYALVWSLISKLDNFIGSMAGTAGVTPLQTNSSKLDSIPTTLADYAMIYRTYKMFRKSLLKNINSQRKLDEVVDKKVVADTLYAASELGIRHTLDVDSLSSLRSYDMYQSMLLAETCEVVYYSLAASSEDNRTELVSHARARAIGRSLDAVISQMFKGRSHEPISDLNRLILMVIRGSVRGSVHRSEPYNRNVVRVWFRYIIGFGDFILKSLPEEYRHQRQFELQEDWGDIPAHIMGTAYEKAVIHFSQAGRLGDISQYHQATKYVKNLVAWGYFGLVKLRYSRCTPSELIDEVIQTSVSPVLAFVRTVSYSTAEAVLRGMEKDVDLGANDEDPLDDAVLMLLDTTPEANSGSHNDLLGFPPSLDYRNLVGPLSLFTIKLKSPGVHEDHLMTTLIYSISLPLIIAAGRSSFRNIFDYKFGPSEMDRSSIESLVSSYSIPQTDDDKGVDIYIMRGLSEMELLNAIVKRQTELSRESVFVVEIPPSATVCSLGIIAHLTSNPLSYITTALSSDYQGFSVYVVAFVQTHTFSFRKRFTRQNNPSVSLGDAAMKSFTKFLAEDDPATLAKIVLTPLHQAGLPINLDLKYNEISLAIEVEEELLDKLSVSFIEAGRPSLPLMKIATIPDERAAYILRALLVRKLRLPVEIKATFVAAYYYHFMFPNLDTQELLELFTLTLDDDVSKRHREYIFRYLLDPICSVGNINPSDFPVGTQILERNVPSLTMPSHVRDTDFSRQLDDFLNMGGVSILPEGETNKVTDYLKEVVTLNAENRYEIFDKLLEKTKPPKNTRTRVESREFIDLQALLPRSEKQAMNYLDDISQNVGLVNPSSVGPSVTPYMTDKVSLPTLMHEITFEGEGSRANEETQDDRIYRLLEEAKLDPKDFDEILESDPEIAEEIRDLPDMDVADAVMSYQLGTYQAAHDRSGVI